MKEHEELVTQLRRISEELISIADALEGQTEEPKKKTKAKAKEPEPAPISLADIKEVLMEKARAGHNDEVRELITSYGAEKLSAIDSSCYEELMQKAKDIGNG